MKLPTDKCVTTPTNKTSWPSPPTLRRLPLGHDNGVVVGKRHWGIATVHQMRSVGHCTTYHCCCCWRCCCCRCCGYCYLVLESMSPASMHYVSYRLVLLLLSMTLMLPVLLVMPPCPSAINCLSDRTPPPSCCSVLFADSAMCCCC